jgi:glutathione S-transferase
MGHIASKQLSAADLFFAPMLAYHAQQFGEERAFKNRAHLKLWMASVGKRQSFLETVK